MIMKFKTKLYIMIPKKLNRLMQQKFKYKLNILLSHSIQLSEKLK